jgi:hypothetical protein
MTFFHGSVPAVPAVVMITLHLPPPLLVERLPGNVRADPCVTPSSFYSEGFSSDVPYFFSKGPNSPQCPVIRYLWSSRRHEYSLFDLEFYGLPEDPTGSFLDHRSLMTASITLCRNGTEGHPSAGAGQLLLGPTATYDPFLGLSVAPYS